MPLARNGSHDPAPDVEDPALEGCTDAEHSVRSVEVEQTAVPMVLRVRWQTEAPGRGELSYRRPDGSIGEAISTEDSTTHEALLVGLPPEVDVPIIIRGQTADGAYCAETEGRTGALSPSFPAAQATIVEPGALDGGFALVPVLKEMECWLTIFNEQGEVVWALRLDPGRHAVGPMAFRMELTPDKSGIIINTQSDRWAGDGWLATFGWDGSLLDAITVPTGHTDFTQLPDGSHGMLGWDVREFDGGRAILGDTIVEIDAEGRQREVWNVFDHFEPSLDEDYPQGFLPADPHVEDWSHVNGIGYDPATDSYLISVSFIDAIIRVDRQTGEQDWMLSRHGEYTDFETTGSEHIVHQPHSVEPVPGGILVLNRRDWAGGTSCSEASEIALDFEAGTATEVWGYSTDLCLHLTFFGNAQRVPNGNTLVTWSSLGQLNVANAEGETAWEIGLGLGAAFAFGRYAASLD